VGFLVFSGGGQEFVDRQTGRADEAPQSPFSDFLMLGHGQGGRLPILDKGDMTAALPAEFPPRFSNVLTTSRQRIAGSGGIMA